MTKLAIRMSAIALACTFTTSALADTYRWVDAEGVVNYSERKPRGVDAELVSRTSVPRTETRPIETAPPPGIPGATQSQPELSERQQEMLTELQTAETDRQDQVAKIRQDNCDTARRVLENLTVRDRVRVRMEDGTTRMLGEEERQARIAEAQQGIVTNCES